jgi:hypothetical protein
MAAIRHAKVSRDDMRMFKALMRAPKEYKRVEVTGEKPLYDKRLLGTWQSDAHKSRHEVRSRTDVSEKAKKTLIRMFGKLRLRYTRTRCYYEYEGFKGVDTYRVIARDCDSVVVADFDPIDGEEKLQHIHFEGEGKYYWISLGKVREYFRNIE